MAETIDSNIIKKNENFSIVNEKLESYFNGKIEYNLIYRASRDGPTTDDFNKNCNGKNNQLIVLKTKKGLIFGGFTARGFQNSDEKKIIDDSVFLYSLNTNKIYNIKKGSCALYELSANGYGIFFGKCDGDNPIFLGNNHCNMLTNMNYTCLKSVKEYEFSKDYELNDGEEYFKLDEIEVYQINKK